MENILCAVTIEDSKKKTMYEALKAHDMYELFVSELKTALRNIATTNKYGMLTMPDMGQYCKGKVDAYEEILERIEKEYDLAKKKYLPNEDTAKFIHYFKNLEANKLIPEDKVRGNRMEMMKRGKIADALEEAFYTGFSLGCQLEDGLEKEKGEQ